MSTSIDRRLATAAVTVLVAGAAFAGGTLTGGASADSPRAISAKQVKKIVTKQIKKQAPSLSVAHAGSADFATSAGQAASAAKVGSSTVKTFAFQVANGGPATAALTLGSFSLVATCPGGSPTLDATSSAGGQMRYLYINASGTTGHGGSAALTDVVVNDPASTGTGSLDYTTGSTAGNATSVSYSWRSDSGACQFLGSYVTG